MIRALFKIVVVLAVAIGLWLLWGLCRPLAPGQRLVMLYPGWSSRRVAFTLEEARVIRSAPAFLLWHYLVARRSLKAGEYAFDHPANALEVYDRLGRGDVFFHTVVIPEGLNIFDIAATMEAAGLSSRQQFLDLARSQAGLIADLDPQARSLEGYLFPDTYRFTRTQSLAEMAGIMVKHFRQEARALGLGPDFHRIVVMASLVEKETAVAGERPLVAAVYYNRLGRNIALAADPSVIYAALLAGRYRGNIYQSDLLSDSPYNTYRHAGMPPGPIANPGREALLAALHPARTDFLYFVSDRQGHHRFARTFEQHQRNVVAYRRAQGGG